MKKKARKKVVQRPAHSFLPRGTRARREVEYLSGAAFALLLIVIVLSFGASGLQQTALRSPQVAAVVSATLVDLANGDRASQDLPALTVNPLLVEAAQAKANDMAAKGYFAHVSPQGIDPWFWFKQVGYDFVYAGENLAVNFSDSSDVNTAWMSSPEHRANILDPHYTQIGIATAQGMYQGRPTTFVVQEFGSPSLTQAPVAAATVPQEPTVIATASTKPQSAAGTSRVLGSATAPAPQKVSELVSQPSTLAPVSMPIVVATTDPALAAAYSQVMAGQTPAWAPLVAAPRDALRDLYWAIGLFVVLALGLDTGFELKWHHRKRAMRVAALLAVMSVLFVVAQAWFFAPPVLAAVGL